MTEEQGQILHYKSEIPQYFPADGQFVSANKPAPTKKRIYLAGGFYKDYKGKISTKLAKDFTLLDPEAGQTEEFKFPGVYVARDIEFIRSADIVLAYMDEYPFVYGVAAEMGMGAVLGKTVIYVAERARVDSFLSGLARATFTNLDAALDFILERYGNSS